MAFVKVKQKSGILKVADLYNSNVVGTYIRKTQSDYSFVYWLQDSDGATIKIFGNRSLDPYMPDTLIGKTIRISCTKLVDTGKALPFAVANVEVWQDETPDSDDELYSMRIPVIPAENLYLMEEH